MCWVAQKVWSKVAVLIIIETLISRLRMTCNVDPKAPEKRKFMKIGIQNWELVSKCAE